MFSHLQNRNHFILGIIFLCFIYILLELFFNSYVGFSVDDFWFAHRIYQYKDGLPYRDFSPYKTVLGYYFLLIPMLNSHGILETLIFTKNTIAIFNTFFLVIFAVWLSKFFSREGVLAGLGLLITSNIFLFYSTNVRVDLFGYWFGFLALICLLENRYIKAGFLLGVGFACTQKIIWYIFSSNITLLALLLIHFFYSQKIKKPILLPTANTQHITLKNIVIFNLATATIIFCYLAGWSLLTSWDQVFNNVFHDAAIMYQLDWYDSARLPFWSYVTFYNPLLYLLIPLTPLCILVTFPKDKTYFYRLFAVIFSFSILFFLMPYKQVFPYYMQVLYPVFFILYAAFFSWLLVIFKQNKVTLLLPIYFFWIYLIGNLIGLILISIIFDLPDFYLIFSIIPMLLIKYTVTLKNDNLFYRLVMSCMVILGLILPGCLCIHYLVKNNGAYQKATINAVSNLIRDGSQYIAGIELIYNRTQPIPGMRHLMGPAIDFLINPSPKLRAVMLPSLYGDPKATQASVIEAIKHSPIKFYVNNYRMNALPEKIKNYLHSQYEHYWGSIYLYAPLIRANQRIARIKFSGRYLIESVSPAFVYLNDQPFEPNTMIHLSRGTYLSRTNVAYRLKYIPDLPVKLFNPTFQEDAWDRVIF